MSMWMRIALHSDFAFVAKPLVAFRFHGSSATAELGPFTGAEHEIEQLPRIFYERRMGFLNDATLPIGEARRYRTIAEKTFRRESVQHLANRAGLGAPWTSTTAGLIRLAHAKPRTLLTPDAIRLVAAQLGGRRVKRVIRRLASHSPT